MVDAGQYLGVVSDTFSGAGAGFAFMVKVMLSAGGVALICFNVWKLFIEYNIKITLMRPIGRGSFKFLMDNAKIRISRDDSTRSLILFRQKHGRNKVTTQVPSHDFKGQWGKKDHYIFILDDNYQLQPVKPLEHASLDHPYLELFPENKRWWARKEDKRRLEKYAKQDFLQKYLPSIVLITAFMVTFFIAYFGFTHLGEGMAELAGQFGQVAASCNNLG